jgi:hypothetical protein
MRRQISIASLMLIAVALTACDRGESTQGFTNEPRVTEPPPITATPEPVLASPTPPAVPDEPPATTGARSQTCVEGWVAPAEGSNEFQTPLQVIRRTARFAGDPVVVEIRMFTGPESPPSDKGYIAEIRRWYVKLYSSEDISYQGRFLVEARTFGRGVAAVAPYDTQGYVSPDWIGFQWEVGAEPEVYPGLPGAWTGIPYDFVNGGEGITIPGLPDEVRGCLDGT